MSNDDWTLDIVRHNAVMANNESELEISINSNGLGVDSPRGDYVAVPLYVLRSLVKKAQEQGLITDDLQPTCYRMKDNEIKFKKLLFEMSNKLNEFDCDIYKYVGLSDSFYDDTPKSVQDSFNELMSNISELKACVARMLNTIKKEQQKDESAVQI